MAEWFSGFSSKHVAWVRLLAEPSVDITVPLTVARLRYLIMSWALHSKSRLIVLVFTSLKAFITARLTKVFYTI